MPVRATTLVSRSRRGLSDDMGMSLQLACAGCTDRTSAWRHDRREALLPETKEIAWCFTSETENRSRRNDSSELEIFWGTLSRQAFFSKSA